MNGGVRQRQGPMMDKPPKAASWASLEDRLVDYLLRNDLKF
jgi:hypothetical protein